jgi:membrane protease YdiL (CAAX protease family)
VRSADADNPLILAAARARRPALGWALVLVAGVWAAGVILVARSIAAAAPSLGGSGPWGDVAETALVNAALYGPMVAGAAMAAGLLESRSIWLAGERPWRRGLAGLALGGGGFALALFTASLAGAVRPDGAPSLGPALVGPFLANGLVVLAAAAGEELYFRGWIQPVLGARWGAWVGLVATAALFSILHIAGGARSLLAAANIFLAGLVFGLMALRSAGLAMPCAAHFAWNWSESSLVGGGADPGPYGAPFALAGAPLWSGGPDTMNGSLATTLVLATLFIGLAALGSRPNLPSPKLAKVPAGADANPKSTMRSGGIA